MVGKGKIVEQGNHADLVSRPGGAYAALVRLQQRDPVLETNPAKQAIEAGDFALTAHSSKQLISQVRRHWACHCRVQHLAGCSQLESAVCVSLICMVDDARCSRHFLHAQDALDQIPPQLPSDAVAYVLLPPAHAPICRSPLSLLSDPPRVL